MKDELIGFLSEAKSSFHVVEYAKSFLQAKGYKELELTKEFVLEENGRYFCCPYDSVMFAFKMSGRIGDGRMHISCAHTDSPSFKLKPVAELGARANAERINVEPYGGALRRTWFDRPLGVAGKLVLRGKSPFRPLTMLFDSNEPWFVIPSLAPHMDREIEEKKLDVQKELIPICSLAGDDKCNVRAMIAEAAGVTAEDIIDYDLNLYVCEKPVRCGKNKDFLLAPRIDNVASVAALLMGITADNDNNDARPEDDADICMVALFDNEEIGSRSKQGADSMLLNWVTDRIYASELMAGVDKMSAITGSYMLSVDGAHAVHPNYPEKADETSRAYLGKGLVLKSSASQRYVSDAGLAAIIRQLCEKYDIMVQLQANKSGTPGGQTLGPIESSYLPIPAVDMGIPMLAMHSSVETVAVSDFYELLKLMEVWNRI